MDVNCWDTVGLGFEPSEVEINVIYIKKKHGTKNTTIEQTKGSILRSTTWEEHWDEMSFKMGFILQQNWTKEK